MNNQGFPAFLVSKSQWYEKLLEIAKLVFLNFQILETKKNKSFTELLRETLRGKFTLGVVAVWVGLEMAVHSLERYSFSLLVVFDLFWLRVSFSFYSREIFLKKYIFFNNFY